MITRSMPCLHCVQSHIVKNVVQYGIYDSMERLLFICKVGGPS